MAQSHPRGRRRESGSTARRAHDPSSTGRLEQEWSLQERPRIVSRQEFVYDPDIDWNAPWRRDLFAMPPSRVTLYGSRSWSRLGRERQRDVRQAMKIHAAESVSRFGYARDQVRRSLAASGPVRRAYHRVLLALLADAVLRLTVSPQVYRAVGVSPVRGYLSGRRNRHAVRRRGRRTCRRIPFRCRDARRRAHRCPVAHDQRCPRTREEPMTVHRTPDSTEYELLQAKENVIT